MGRILTMAHPITVCISTELLIELWGMETYSSYCSISVVLVYKGCLFCTSPYVGNQVDYLCGMFCSTYDM